MAIVTIFAGTLGDDEEVARKVATQLGYAFIRQSVGIEDMEDLTADVGQ